MGSNQSLVRFTLKQHGERASKCVIRNRHHCDGDLCDRARHALLHGGG